MGPFTKALRVVLATSLLLVEGHRIFADKANLTDDTAGSSETDDTAGSSGSCTAANGKGMSVTFSVASKADCMQSCGPTTSIGGENYWTFQRRFADSFTVSFNQKCECSIAGRKMIAFKPLHKAQAEECAAGTGRAIHDACFDMYEKARGTRFQTHGRLKVPMFKVPFQSKEFKIKRKCKDACEVTSGTATCESIVPTALDGMDKADLAALGKAIKDIREGNLKDVPSTIKDLVEILPDEDLNLGEFAAIDTNGDDHLYPEELLEYYPEYTPEEMAHFIKQADISGNGAIDKDEFFAFKDAMENYDPNVDLLTGLEYEYLNEDGIVSETNPRWQATSVECMQNGAPAPRNLCEGTPTEAIIKFNSQC